MPHAPGVWRDDDGDDDVSAALSRGANMLQTST